MAAPQGHAQVELKKADGSGAHRAVLGFWDETWRKDDPTMAQLFSAYRASLSALQRHQEGDDFAAMRKARGGPQVPPDERIEFRNLDREMAALEAVNIDAITTDLSARKNALSPFSAPLDKSDISRAMIRMQIRADLKAMKPDQLRAALRTADETMSAAILEAPHYSSGLAPEMHANFREQRLHALHGEKMQALDAANAAVKLTARCLDAAKTSTRERILPFLPPVEPDQKPATTTPWVA